MSGISRFVLFCGLASVSLPMWGQNYGSITGTVIDSSGAGIAGAKVTATNTATNTTRNSETNGAGSYTIPFLVPGVYNVQAEASGFKLANHTGIVLQVEATARIDFTMELGEINQTVEVNATAALLTTEGSGVGTVVESGRIQDLPLNGRNYLQLVTLSPNVTAELVPGGTSTLRQGGERSQQDFSIGGQRIEFNHYTLDGVENTDPNFNTWAVRPSVDAIQEFKVETGVYSAEYGRGIGQISVTTSPGTNQYHGTVFEFLRNSLFDAREWNQAAGIKNPFRRNQFGYTLGGPVVVPRLFNGRDRLFFMSNFEELEERQTLQSIGSVATNQMRSGDFSASGFTIYDPLSRTFTKDANGNPLAVSAVPFPNNEIPVTRFNNVAQSLLQLPGEYPAPTVPSNSTANNYYRQGPHSTAWQQFNFRADFNESAKSFWFSRFGWNDEYFQQRGASGAGAAGPFPTSEGRYLTTVYQAMLANIRPLSSTVVNESRFGWTHFSNTQLTHFGYLQNVQAQLAIPGISDVGPIGWGAPSVGLANGLTGFGDGPDGPYVTANDIFEWLDNVSIVRGSHSLRIGGEIRRDRVNEYGNVFTRGSYSFAGTNGATANPASPLTTGYSFADFLLGYASSARNATSLTNTMLRGTSTAGYVEDVWKVTPKLTLNIGLRYEYFQPYHDKYRGITNFILFDPGVGPNGLLAGTKTPVLIRPGSQSVYQDASARFTDAVPTANGAQLSSYGVGNALVKDDRLNFAPRVGLAYAPSNAWTIRSGLGIFYVQDITNGMIFETGRNLAGGYLLNTNPQTQNINLSNPFASNTAVCTGWTGVCQAAGTQVESVDPNLRTPYVIQWLFTIQRQLAKNLVLETGYIGNEGHRLDRGHLYNTAVLPTGPNDASTQTQRRPWPVYGNIQSINGDVNSNYHAATGKLTQNLTQGLTYILSFTWSKAIDGGSSIRPGAAGTYSAINAYNFHPERGLSDFDVPVRFVASPMYQLPFGHGKRFANRNAFGDKIVGGWQLGSVVTLAHGTPWTVGSIGNTNNTSSNVPNATGISPFPADPTPQHYWNIAAFNYTDPVLRYQYGNVARNVLFVPGTMEWDFSAIKKTSIREHDNLEFRFEVFNLPNHPNWSPPVSSAPNAPATFGVITSAKTMREMQLALKYSF